MTLSFPRLFAAGCAALFMLAGPAVHAAAATKPAKKGDDFMPYVELAPFVVNGERLSISVHARTKRDRRYAEDFAEEVVKVVAESVTKETGKGLVIIGKKGEPHPVFIFRKFLALAREGKLDPAVAAKAGEVAAELEQWHDMVGEEKTVSAEGSSVDLEAEKIVAALPLPLAGTGAKLYQLAWAEGFDEGRIEARLRALKPGELEGNLFARFDWVFYLPPRGALEQAIDDVIAAALKEEDVGFLARTAIKGAMLVVKPVIRRAIEAVRQGLLFQTVVAARGHYAPDDTSALTSAYLNALMPDEGHAAGKPHDRAVQAIRAKVDEIAARAAAAAIDPAPTPKPEVATKESTD